MKLVIFGLSLSSSWGNGHATVWRALLSALHQRGHRTVLFEADVPYYADHRDLREPPFADLRLYPSWSSVAETAARELADADIAIVSSYCPDATMASQMVLSSKTRLRLFYDLDTPVTLSNLEYNSRPSYLPAGDLADFDLVLSFTGGPALDCLKTRLRARQVAALYGSVDPQVYRPLPSVEQYRCDLSYLGTYADDRQRSLERLFVETASRLPERRFLLGGSLYPSNFPWRQNISYSRHVAPHAHPLFYCSSRTTLNLTRRAMAAMGYCPSGRLFEAAACGTVILSDEWDGIDQFFTRDDELLIVTDTADVVAALNLSDGELSRIATAARTRVLSEHTGANRALEFERIVAAAK